MLKYLLLFFTTLLSFNVYASENTCLQGHCIAVVDAGSTGSRLHVYAYDLDKTSTPVAIRSVFNKKIKPGLAAIEPAAIDKYLNDLLLEAPVPNIPLYFYATAGMRLLPINKQKMYYQAINNWFGAQKNWQLLSAKTITGKDEALLDWLAVNYQLGRLSSKDPVGVMDMGGASVQIVFPIKNKQVTNEKDIMEVSLYGRKTTLYLHSFLGLGQTEVSRQFLNDPDCYTRNYPLPDGDKGEGNALLCEKEVAAVMNATHHVNSTIQPLLAQTQVSTWYALGGISNLAESALFQFEKNELTPQGMLEQADRQVCSNVWDDLDRAFPNNDYVYQYCFNAAYFVALLVDGYGLSPTQPVHYMPTQLNLDWTLGVVLHH